LIKKIIKQNILKIKSLNRYPNKIIVENKHKIKMNMGISKYLPKKNDSIIIFLRMGNEIYN